MKIEQGHEWIVSPKRAVEIQRGLAGRVRLKGLKQPVRLAAGLDASFDLDENYCFGAAVLWDVEKEVVVERHLSEVKVNFPYIPGLLSFREGPALMEALRKLANRPEVLIFDGAGIAHQRRLGIASHLGVLTGLPSIGCAKNSLIGEYQLPSQERGAITPIIHNGEIIGTVLRTQREVRPLFVSIGHGLSLKEAEKIVLACSPNYRIPEPLRLAHQLASAAKRKNEEVKNE